MTSNDVTQILVRLGVIESKIDSTTTEAKRVRRLELIVAVLCAFRARDLATVVGLMG